VPGAGDRPGAGGAPGPAGATGLSRAAHSYGTAAPSDVAKAVGAMANTIEELGSGYLAGLDSTLVRLQQQLNSEIAERDRLCT
jgi:HPt (histidine-containing phosphotransfer) domain-containing protein